MMEDTLGKMPGDLPTRPDMDPKLKQAMLDQDTFIAKTFCSPSGRKTLKWLRDLYIDSPPVGYVVDGRGAINAEATTFQLYQLQGQRTLIQNIEMRIKRANSSPVRPAES